MPVEIRELHIKVLVQDDTPKPERMPNAAVAAGQVDAIVAECVEQVVRIIKEKKER